MSNRVARGGGKRRMASIFTRPGTPSKKAKTDTVGTVDLVGSGSDDEGKDKAGEEEEEEEEEED